MGFDDIVLEYTPWVEFRLADSWASTMADAIDVNDDFIDIEEALNETPGMSGMGYQTKSDEILKLSDNLKNLQLYVDYLPEDIHSLVDKPLYEEFNEGATEAISQIKLEDITTENTIGLTAEIGIQESSTTQSVELEYLNLGDFTGANIGNTLTSDYVTSTQVNCVDSFANMYKVQYENLVKLEYLDSSMTLESYLDSLMNRGEINNEMDKPILNFVSEALDITGIDPIIEAIRGKESLTGEILTDSQRSWKAVEGVLILATLGISGVASTGGKAAIKTIGREMVIDAGATGASVIAASTGIPGLALLASMATGTSISKGIDGSFALKVGDDIIPLTASQADELAAATGKPIIDAINPSQIDEVVGVADDVAEVLPIGGEITGYTDHGSTQALGRDGGRGVSSSAIKDAVENPQKVIPQKGEYGTTYKYVGNNAVVVLNESGQVVTTYATNSAGLRGGN